MWHVQARSRDTFERFGWKCWKRFELYAPRTRRLQSFERYLYTLYIYRKSKMYNVVVLWRLRFNEKNVRQ